MSQPTVCCVMLTADRPEYAKRAVECFRAQTYPRKRLLICDTGNPWMRNSFEFIAGEFDFPMLKGVDTTLGALRNFANELSHGEGDIICHWDDDDWSHPNRIAEQVALLESTGADVCGYNEMIFWRSSRDSGCQIAGTGEAWLYTGSILGTSLCYRRAVWERFPFPATSYGEDTEWLKQVAHAKLKVTADSSMNLMRGADPRMIARIHAGNTSKAYAPEAMRAAPHHWGRVPEWDAHCREVME